MEKILENPEKSQLKKTLRPERLLSSLSILRIFLMLLAINFIFIEPALTQKEQGNKNRTKERKEMEKVILNDLSLIVIGTHEGMTKTSLFESVDVQLVNSSLNKEYILVDYPDYNIWGGANLFPPVGKLQSKNEENQWVDVPICRGHSMYYYGTCDSPPFIHSQLSNYDDAYFWNNEWSAPPNNSRFLKPGEKVQLQIYQRLRELPTDLPSGQYRLFFYYEGGSLLDFKKKDGHAYFGGPHFILVSDPVSFQIEDTLNVSTTTKIESEITELNLPKIIQEAAPAAIKDVSLKQLSEKSQWEINGSIIDEGANALITINEYVKALQQIERLNYAIELNEVSLIFRNDRGYYKFSIKLIRNE